jgi:hypothetical protein
MAQDKIGDRQSFFDLIWIMIESDVWSQGSFGGTKWG